MKLFRKFVACFFALIFVSLSGSCKKGMDVVGVDSEGEKQVLVPAERFAKQMSDYLTTIHRATLATLAKAPQNEEAAWQVHYVKVGLGLEGTVKIAAVRTLAAAPRLSLYFSNKNFGRGQ